MLDGHFIGIGVVEEKYEKACELIAENWPEYRYSLSEMG